MTQPCSKLALVNSEYGVFLGYALGLAFFSGLDTGGQTHAATFDSELQASDLLNVLLKHMDGEFRFVPVASGHWRDLQAAGLPIADMADNELRNAPPAGSA